MRIGEILDNVAVWNRVVDQATAVIFDNEVLIWQPGETRYMPRLLAEWFVSHSIFLLNPENGKRLCKLVVLGKSQDESDLTAEQVNRPELLDRENMRPTAFDKDTMKPLRTVYLDPNGVGGVEEVTRRFGEGGEGPEERERRVKQGIADRNRSEAADQIAKAAAQLSDEEI